MKIIKRESSNDTTNVERAIRKLKYIQKEISEAIKYLESDAECKDAICAMSAELYRANDIATALAADAQRSHSDVKTESLEDGDRHDDGDSIRELEKRKAESENNSVSDNIPDKIDTFLKDVAQMTNIISYNDIIKFGNKLSQSEQYRKFALGGIEHLINRWGEALLYEDELMMDDIAYDIKSYMTYPIQKTVTNESIDAHRESFRLNNVVFSVMFDGDSVSVKSHHPYDEAKYHYAISNDGGHNFKIYRDYKFVEDFTTKSFDCDEESGIKNFNWREIARELLRLDQGIEPIILHN